MSKVRKWMMEERGDCVEKVDMPDKAIKLFGKTISLSVYLNPNIEQNTEKAMDATCPTDSRFGCDPIYIQEQAQFPPSSQEDENLPSLADEARSSASSNSGCDEDKQGDSVAADNPLAALEVTETKPADGSVEVSEKTKSDQDPPSSGVSVEKARRRPNKAVPCPRCESMDTKFCYYNNYNLSQPRHFCKNCQRYWTAGGSLRNVPVGAGRRRNKHAPAQQWHVLRADPMEAAQPLISCAFPQTVNIPLDLDLLRTAPKIGLPSIIKHDTCSLLSNSSESIVSNINQKDCSGQPCVASGQELQKSDYSRGRKTSLKDDVGCYGWPGASPVSPLNGPWPLLYNMRWIHSPLQAAGATVSPLPALIDTNAGSASQACPSVPSGWTSAFSTSLGAAAAAAMAAAAVANVKSMGDMQVLGKHPRTESCKEGEKTKSLWAPKTQRLTGPGEEARSSIMAILAAAKKPESITSGSMSKVFQSKQASQPDKHPAISTPLQESN